MYAISQEDERGPETGILSQSGLPRQREGGEASIGIPSRTKRRFRCQQWGKTFATITGTMWYRLRTAAEEVRIAITVLAHGCPQHALVAAYGLDERLVANGLVRTGEQS